MSGRPPPKPQDVEILLTFLLDENAETVRLARTQVAELARANPDFYLVVEGARDPRVRHEARKVLEDIRINDLELEFTRLSGMANRSIWNARSLRWRGLATRKPTSRR